MNFYNILMDQDMIYEGLEAPRTFTPRVLTPEQRAQKNAEMDKLFASFAEQWRKEKNDGR